MATLKHKLKGILSAQSSAPHLFLAPLPSTFLSNWHAMSDVVHKVYDMALDVD